jgi:hypothetical protein
LRRHDVPDPYHYARGRPQVQFYPDHADPFRHNYDPRSYPTFNEYEDECYDEWEDEEEDGQVETGRQ